MRPAHMLSTLALPVVLASQTLAQTPLIFDGDTIPLVGNVTAINNLAVNNGGMWRLELDTDNAMTDFDGVVIGPLGTVLTEGQALPLPVGALLDSFDSISLNNLGDTSYNHFLDGTTGGSDDSGIYFNDDLLIQEGAPSTAAGFSAGTIYTGFFETKLNDSNLVLIMASVDDPAIPSTTDRALVLATVGPGGSLISEVVFAKEGDILPGQSTPANEFGTGPHEMALSNTGAVMFSASIDGNSSEDVVYIDSTLLAQVGTPSPVAGRNWSSFSSAEVDLNDVGDHVYAGSLDGDTASNLLIIKNGAKFVQEGDSLPDIAPHLFTSFGSGPLYVGNNGDVLWYGDWNDPLTTQDTGLFINDNLIIQEGVTMVGANTIMSLSGISDGYQMSDDGTQILFEARLDDGRDVALIMDNPFANFTSFCTSGPNSTGAPALISATGTTSITANDLNLSAAPVPANQFGVFYYGGGQLNTPFGNGVRCVGTGGIGAFRFPITNSGAMGQFQWTFDNTAPPIPAGQVTSGSTWYFQCWFRDPMAGGAAFDLTDGLAVTFVP